MPNHEAVSEFYGQTVKRTEDLSYDACCVADYDASMLDHITDEVKERRYGCGSPLPPLLSGLTVLDLGCGAGIDVFAASRLVGPEGRVIGVDMTDTMLDVARRNVAPIMTKLGYDAPNVEFHLAQIEELPVESASVDVVISNCVINLSPHKERVFAELRRVLKPGGEFYIADIVADRRIPARLTEDKRLYSECLTGAAYTGDLRRLMQRAGFEDVRTVQSRRLSDCIEGIHFDSVMLRGFAMELEDACEDYGQVALYRGTIPGAERAFVLDQGHSFVAGMPLRVCKNTAAMLKASRYESHFHVSDEIFHLGLFDCDAPAHQMAVTETSTTVSSAGCC